MGQECSLSLTRTKIRIDSEYYLLCIHGQTLVCKLVLKWQSRNREHAYRQERKLQGIYDRLERPTRAVIRDQVSVPFDCENPWHHTSLLQLFLPP